MNLPRVARACEKAHQWDELVFVYVHSDEFESAAKTMMEHPACWDASTFKDIITKVGTVDPYYKAITFYLGQHPASLNDLLTILASKLDHGRVVSQVRKAQHLPLIK